VVSVAVDGATTLEGLVAAINAKNAGVRASAVNAGTAAVPAWKLTMTTTATGAATNIVVAADGTTLGIANTQAAADAAFSITGLGSFTRATNTFSDVLDGVTITLKAAGTTDLALDYDTNATQSRVQSLLDAVNDAARAIDRQSAGTKGADGKVTPGTFTGDVVPRQLRAALTTAIATRIAGTYGHLAEIGVTTGKDGTLSLDATKFQAALTADPAAVAALLGGSGAADGVADRIAAAAAEATASVTGAIAARQAGLTTTIRSVDGQIDRARARLDATERSLRARFVALERAVATIQATGNSLLTQLAQLSERR
jgi:flagellar hook-associated protein 2